MSTAARRLHPVLAFGHDLVAVLVFCAVGRASHQEDATIVGYLTTLWPFAVALVVAHALVAATRRLRPEGFAAAGIVWAVVVGLGMLLRAASGQGTALAFVIVTAITLAVFFSFWRLVLLLVRRASARRAA
jgi:hypothetical protein